MKGILLVNLGTPDSPRLWDVYRYLIEFLTDEKVIDIPWLKRQLLVRGVIVPDRLRQSTASYKKIWTKEGSPLMSYGRKVKSLFQERQKDSCIVELAMRYQNPSIEAGLLRLISNGAKEILLFPLFPQYADATTGSIEAEALRVCRQIASQMPLRIITTFADHPAFIAALAAIPKAKEWKQYDHVLFSYHGLPERQLKKKDGACLIGDCCVKNKNCYRSQCYATTHALVKALQIPAEKYSVCFQSRLGKEPWLQPYASDVLSQRAKAGDRRLLVFSPSFVSDCLETLYEIGEEYQAEFKHAGGLELDLVPGLNDSPLWIEALCQIAVDFNQKLD